MIETCKDLLDRYADVIHIPQDVVVADSFSADAESKIVPFDKIPDGWMGLDIGPASRDLFASKIADAVKAMKADGTLSKLSEKWYGQDYSKTN